jgi:hypothetical protein
MVALKQHLAGITQLSDRISKPVEDDMSAPEIVSNVENDRVLFDKIVRLHVGEALIFSPSAMVSLRRHKESAEVETIALGSGHLKILVRNRLTTHGGISVMANGI